MKTQFAIGTFLGAVAMTLSACGGGIADGGKTDGGAATGGAIGGTGGGGGTGATGGGDGTGGTAATICSGVGDPAVSLCMQWAEALHSANCPWESKMDECIVLFQLETCTAELTAWVECNIAAPSCPRGHGSPGPCPAQYTALTQCLGSWPEPPHGGRTGPLWLNCVNWSGGSCHCDSYIIGFPGPVVAAYCEPRSDGQLSCTCSIDDTTVGTCDGAPGCVWPGCDLYVGCCSQFWQSLGPPGPMSDVACSGGGGGVDQGCGCGVFVSKCQPYDPSPEPGCPPPVTTDCKPSPGGEVLCTCSIGATTVGTCSAVSGQTCAEPGAETFAGDPWFGCCSQFW